jgi:DNA-binding ferritin-like protein (Dps family)
MAAKWVETLTGSLEQKKQYKQYKARIGALPEPYGSVAKALQRYFLYYGGVTDGETALTMLGDFADLWERAAADGTPVREIVGDDPVEFADTFAQAYTGTQWIDKERARLTKAIEDAERGHRNDSGDTDPGAGPGEAYKELNV